MSSSTSGGEWTTVTKGSKSARPMTSETPSGPSPPLQTLTLPAVLQHIDTLRTQFRNSPASSSLRQVLRRWRYIRSENNDLNITSAVCLATGTFTGQKGNRNRSLWQLVGFLEVIDLLRGMERKKISSFPVVAGDPVYNELDKEVLRALGISPLASENEEEKGYLGKDGTVLFAPFLQWEVLVPEFLEEREYELLVTADLKDGLGTIEREGERLVGKEKRDSYVECLKRVFEGCDATYWPGCGELGEGQQALEGLTFYWKKSLDEDD